MNKNAKLKNRRIELGLTMLELSQKVGVSEATISRWESGNIVNIRSNHLISLANALQVSLSYIDSSIPENKFPIVSKYNRLNNIGQIKTEAYIDGLLENPLYCKDVLLQEPENPNIIPITSEQQPEIAALGGNNEGELPQPTGDVN